LVRNKWIAITALVIVSAGAYWLVKSTPTGFIQTEDQGFLLYAVKTPPGSSLDRTREATQAIEKIVREEQGADHHYVVDGLNFISFSNASPYATGFIRLKDYDKRGAVKNPDDIAVLLTQKVSQIKGASTFFFNFPTVQGFGNI